MTSPKIPILAALCALGLFQVFMASCATNGAQSEERLIARQRFDNYCAGCHGLDGKGHGPASMSLNPQATDLTDREWQALVTDEDLYLVISQGTAAAGLSPLMPASPFADRPGIIDALVEIVRSFDNQAGR